MRININIYIYIYTMIITYNYHNSIIDNIIGGSRYSNTTYTKHACMLHGTDVKPLSSIHKHTMQTSTDFNG